MDNRPILVGIDFSEVSLQAFDTAVDLATSLDAPLHLVFVLKPPMVYCAVGWGLETHYQPLPAADEAEASLCQLAASHPALGISCSIMAGQPADAILQLACTLMPRFIVMGTHGRSGLGRLFVGGTTEAVIRRAPCPVISVRQLRPSELEQPAIPSPSSVPVSDAG